MGGVAILNWVVRKGFMEKTFKGIIHAGEGASHVDIRFPDRRKSKEIKEARVK